MPKNISFIHKLTSFWLNWLYDYNIYLKSGNYEEALTNWTLELSNVNDIWTNKVLSFGRYGQDAQYYINGNIDLKADVLKVGHHGSKTSSSAEFIDKVNPKYSIISVGKNNRYGHPNKEVLDNLKDSNIYRTDQDGSIMFKIKNNKLKIETCSP